MTHTELRALDLFIAEMVMGWKRCEFETMPRADEYRLTSNGSIYHDGNIFTPTESPADSMMVLKRVGETRIKAWDEYRPDVTLCIYAPRPEWNDQWIVSSDASNTIQGAAPTLELAICLFAREVTG